MALNSAEQQLFDYIQKNPEERHFWEQKVRSVAAAQPDDIAAAVALDMLLRAYVAERAQVSKQLADMPPGMSQRSLAEYLVRVWTNPRPKKKKKAGDNLY